MTGGEDKSVGTKRRRFRCRKNPKQRKYKKRKQRRRDAQTLGWKDRSQVPPLGSQPYPVNSVPSWNMNYGQCFWENYRRALEWRSSCVEDYWKRRAGDLLQENTGLRQRLSLYHTEPDQQQESNAEFEAYDETVTEDESEPNSESEYEVSEEFMKFIEISLRHKASRNQEKGVRDEGKSDSCAQGATKPYFTEEGIPCPTEDGSARRWLEMKELYGNGSARIQGMEAAVHVSFLHKCDKVRPVLWPVLPLSSSNSV